MASAAADWVPRAGSYAGAARWVLRVDPAVGRARVLRAKTRAGMVQNLTDQVFSPTPRPHVPPRSSKGFFIRRLLYEEHIDGELALVNAAPTFPGDPLQWLVRSNIVAKGTYQSARRHTFWRQQLGDVVTYVSDLYREENFLANWLDEISEA